MLSGISIICFAACYAIAFVLELVGLKMRVRVARAALMLRHARRACRSHAVSWPNRRRRNRRCPFRPSNGCCWPPGCWPSFIFAALFYLPRTPTGLVLLPIVLGLIASSLWASPEPLAPSARSTSGRCSTASCCLLGTVAVCVGFLAGLMYLVQSYALKHVRSPANGLRLPSLEWLERVNSRTLGLSAVLIALGFISGIVMSIATHRDEAAYTLWTDPVVLSLAQCSLWLVAAEVFRLVYPAARRGRKVAYLTLASFVFLVIALASLMLLDNGARNTIASRPKVRKLVRRRPHPQSAIRNPQSRSHEHRRSPHAWSAAATGIQPGGPRAACLHAGANARRPGRLARDASR